MPIAMSTTDADLRLEGELSDRGIDAIARLLLKQEDEEIESSIGRSGGLDVEPVGGRKAAGGSKAG